MSVTIESVALREAALKHRCAAHCPGRHEAVELATGWTGIATEGEPVWIEAPLAEAMQAFVAMRQSGTPIPHNHY